MRGREEGAQPVNRGATRRFAQRWNGARNVRAQDFLRARRSGRALVLAAGRLLLLRGSPGRRVSAARSIRRRRLLARARASARRWRRVTRVVAELDVAQRGAVRDDQVGVAGGLGVVAVDI